MLLFGEASNPSNGFYEKFGAERIYGDGGEFHGSYGWRDLHSWLRSGYLRFLLRFLLFFATIN